MLIRFPDATYRAAVFSVMRFHYPWLINCKVLFLDVPSIIAVRQRSSNSESPVPVVSSSRLHYVFVATRRA